MHILKRLAMLAVILLIASGVKAAIMLPEVKEGAVPALDGKLDDPAWQQAYAMELAEPAMPLRPAIPGTKTTVRFLVGGGKLYIGAECHAASGAALKGEKREHDGPVFEDESLELFIAPDGGAIPTNYYHFALNVSGSTTERKILDPAWNTDWQSAASAGKDLWTAEMAIPLGALAGGEAAGHYWRINVCRNMYDAKGSFAQGLVLARPGYHTPNVLVMTGPVGAAALLASVNATLGEMEKMKEYLSGPDKKQFKELEKYRAKLEKAKDAMIPAEEALNMLETAWKNAGDMENNIILNYMFEK
ncbi:MAG: sugar-binding protein [Kiritimatiellia bacterium]